MFERAKRREEEEQEEEEKNEGRGKIYRLLSGSVQRRLEQKAFDNFRTGEL